MPDLNRARLSLAVALASVLLLSGCGLASRGAAPGGGGSHAAPGERPGTIPAAARTRAAPLDPQPSPRDAVLRFASQYINWTSVGLTGDLRRLAAEAVGEARMLEQQARAQSERDSTIRRGQIYNTGRVIAATPVPEGQESEWVIVTRERTGGAGQYPSQAGWHVTLARVSPVGQDWAVSRWRPES